MCPTHVYRPTVFAEECGLCSLSSYRPLQPHVSRYWPSLPLEAWYSFWHPVPRNCMLFLSCKRPSFTWTRTKEKENYTSEYCNLSGLRVSKHSPDLMCSWFLIECCLHLLWLFPDIETLPNFFKDVIIYLFIVILFLQDRLSFSIYFWYSQWSKSTLLRVVWYLHFWKLFSFRFLSVPSFLSILCRMLNMATAQLSWRFINNILCANWRSCSRMCVC